MSGCVECGRTRQLVQHHTDYEADSTVTVCRGCHQTIHANPSHELYPNGSPDETSIRISDPLADELHSRKSRGESYEDVIWQMIESEEIDADALEQLIEKMRDDRESSAHVYAYELEELIEDE